MDALTDKVYNSKSVKYDKNNIDEFVYTEFINVNCRQGFFKHKQQYKIAVEPYFYFNLRENEILIRLTGNDLYKRLRKKSE